MKTLNVILLATALCASAASPVFAANGMGGGSGHMGGTAASPGGSPAGSGSLFQSGSDDSGNTNGGGAPLAGKSDSSYDCDNVRQHPSNYTTSAIDACKAE